VMSVRLTKVNDYKKLLGDYDTWLFDCDGVLWHDGQVIDGVIEVLGILRRQGKKIIFVTNNATKSRRTYKAKFNELGVDVNVDEIYGSAYSAAVYLSSVIKLAKDKKVYVIGMKGLEEELREEGFNCLGGTDPADNALEPFDLSQFTLDPDVGAVVCGLDMGINYIKLSKAFQYLTRIPGCHFIATNEDRRYPVPGGFLPGAGAVSAPLRYAVRDPICTGKPSTTMLDCIKAKVNFDPKKTIMVGDGLSTDILFGKNGGLTTLLVLTGITTEEEISGPNASSIVPDFITQALGDFCALKEIDL